MRKNDARKLDHKTLEELRMRVVKRVQDGASPEVLAKALDLHRSTVYGWLARYRQGGWNGLKAKPIAGRPPKLGGKKMQWVSDTVTQEPVAIEIRVRAVDARDGSCADQGQVRDKPSAVSVGRLLAQLWIACRKPLHRAQERDEVLVQQWLKTEYPHIKAMAQEVGADIYFGDAAHMRSDHHAGRTWSKKDMEQERHGQERHGARKTWGKKGETPIVEATGARHGMSLISAITSHGHMRFMLIEKGGVNADVFIEFLKRLAIGAKRAIFLIVDRGPAHIAKKTKAFVESLNGALRLFYFRLLARSQSRRTRVEASEADTVGA